MTPGVELGVRYRELASRVRAFAARRVPADSVDDIVSETFTRAFGRIDAYAQRGSDIGAWLIAIASNLIIDTYRRRTRRPEVLGAVPERAERIIDLDAYLDVARAVATLPERDRAFIDARFTLDLEQRQAGESIGWTKMQAWRGEQRILSTLRELVDA